MTAPNVRAFRAALRQAFPAARVSVRTVSFVDLARCSRACLDILDAAPDDVSAINSLARAYGIIPDTSVRFSE